MENNISKQSAPLKYIWLFSKYLLLLQTLFFSFIIISAWLPNENYRKNISKSLSSVIKEGDYPEPMIKKRKHGLDYSMDAFTMNIIYSVDNKNPLKSAILASSKHSDLPDLSKWDQLKFSIENDSISPNLNYPRYWHGGASLFRYFFLFTDFDGVKWAIYFITSILFLIFGLMLFQKTNMVDTLLFFLGFVFVNSYISQFSMQFAPVLIITLLTSISIIYQNSKSFTRTLIIFLVAGAATSFMDLLTTPLITFGLPVLIWIRINPNLSFSKHFGKIVLMGVFWIGAYSITWLTKWMLTAFFTDFQIFTNVLNEISSVTNNSPTNLFLPVIKNINQLPLVFINIIFLFQILLLLFFFKPKGIYNAILYCLISLIPILWFIIMADHSVRHYWFTYRALSISLIGLFYTFNALLDKEKFIEWIVQKRSFLQNQP